MLYPNYTPESVTARGEEIYQQQIRHKVEPDHKGKFLVLDIETGDYEIDAKDLEATMRLLAKYPKAVTYGLRIGYPAAYGIGFNFSVENAVLCAIFSRSPSNPTYETLQFLFSNSRYK